MKDILDLVVSDVEHVAVRGVVGHGSDQAELVITTRRGALTLRLLGRRPIRVTDRRAKDRGKARPTVVQVPFADR